MPVFHRDGTISMRVSPHPWLQYHFKFVKNFTLVEAATENWRFEANFIDEPLRTGFEEMELSLKTLNLGLKTLLNKIEALI